MMGGKTTSAAPTGPDMLDLETAVVEMRGAALIADTVLSSALYRVRDVSSAISMIKDPAYTTYILTPDQSAAVDAAIGLVVERSDRLRDAFYGDADPKESADGAPTAGRVAA